MPLIFQPPKITTASTAAIGANTIFYRTHTPGTFEHGIINGVVWIHDKLIIPTATRINFPPPPTEWLSAPFNNNTEFALLPLSPPAPPSSIEIEASSYGVVVPKQNNKIDVKENQDLMLQCTVANSKPAAEIKWYRGHVELRASDNRHDSVIPLDNKRFTVSSNLTIKASANDDLVDYTCRAKHQALSPEHPMKTTVQVSVLKPPGEPFVEGYSKGERLRSGQEVELVCRSYGGNPPAQLIWYKNNRQVVSQYTTSGRDSASTYRFKVQPSDNKARLRCEASNTISEKSMKKELDLSVSCEFSNSNRFSRVFALTRSGRWKVFVQFAKSFCHGKVSGIYHLCCYQLTRAKKSSLYFFHYFIAKVLDRRYSNSI